MDSKASSPPPSSKSTTVAHSVSVEALVDPFLVEALQNPRHRLTILRMELDIQKFLRNSDQLHFEFQHFPTSYLRLAAHRVAQHYGLLTMVQDNFSDGQGSRIVVKKIGESVYPRVCLSEVPIKQSENDSIGQKKIVIRSRPSSASSNDNSGLRKQNSIKSVEERKEEYDRARARIFSGFSCPESEDTASLKHQKNVCVTGIENEASRNAVIDMERNLSSRDGGTSSRVAIIRDREKDRIDPDYDRSYERYIRNLPNTQNFSLTPIHMQNFKLPPYLQYDSVLPQLGQMPNTQASSSYCYSNPIMSPYCASRPNQSSMDAVYMQWPSPAMIYTQSYDQFRHAVFQVPIYQHPLSFDYSHNN